MYCQDFLKLISYFLSISLLGMGSYHGHCWFQSDSAASGLVSTEPPFFSLAHTYTVSFPPSSQAWRGGWSAFACRHGPRGLTGNPNLLPRDGSGAHMRPNFGQWGASRILCISLLSQLPEVTLLFGHSLFTVSCSHPAAILQDAAAILMLSMRMTLTLRGRWEAREPWVDAADAPGEVSSGARPIEMGSEVRELSWHLQDGLSQFDLGFLLLAAKMTSKLTTVMIFN